jgi:drug/metabolite transporter (DMT)-like permease
MALFSGAMWGAGAVILGVALEHQPLVAVDSLVLAPLVAAAIHDCFAMVWVSAVNVGARQLRSTVLAWRTRSGLIISVAALLGGPFAMSAYVLSISFAGAPYAVAVASVFPALGALLGHLVLGDRLSRVGWLGVCMAVGGAALASYEPASPASSYYGLGLICAFLAALGWAAEGVLASHCLSRMPSTMALNIRETVSAAAFVVIVLPLFGATEVARATMMSSALWILVAASLLGAGSYLLFYRSLHLLGPARAMPANSTSVLWTIGIVLLITREPPSWRLIVGSVVLVLGILLVAKDTPRNGAVLYH